MCHLTHLSPRSLTEEGGKAGGDTDATSRVCTCPRRAPLRSAHPGGAGGGDERRQRALLAATVTWRRRGSGLPGKTVCAGSGAEVGGGRAAWGPAVARRSGGC